MPALKTLGRTAALCAALLLASTSAIAVEPAAPPTDDEGNFAGVLLTVEAGKIALKDALGEERTFTVDENTKITVAGEPGKISQLAAGMQVTVMADAEGHATSIITIEKPPLDRPTLE